MHNEYKERIILPGVLSIRHAALFLFLNKTGAHNGYRGYLKDKFKAAMNKNKELLICDIDTLTTDSRLLENVEFMPGNFTEALREIDEKTFFFFNPPYSPIDKPLHLGNELKEESDLKWQDIFSYCDYLHTHGAKFLLVLPYYPSELKVDEFVAHWNNQYQVVKVDEWLWLNTRQNKQDETQNILIKNY